MAALADNGPDPGTTAYQYAMLYWQAGCSVIPVPRGQKGGNDGPQKQISWAKYQQRRATPDELSQWFNTSEPPNMAIVLGEISGNLLALDADQPLFSSFLVEQVASGTPQLWWNRTGSGKVHLLLRSDDLDLATTHLYLPGTNEKLADIRGNGAYVLVPPSLHPSGGTYQILSHVLPQIARVPSALRAFQNIRDSYARTVGQSVTQLLKVSHGFVPALEDDDLRALRSEVEDAPVAPKVKRAVFEGATHNSAEWSHLPTDSEVDYAVMAGFFDAGWDLARVEQIFATFMIGKTSYWDTSRPNHGSTYLATGRKSWEHKQAIARTSAAELAGNNFEIIDVMREDFDVPRYYLTIRCPDGRERVCRMLTEDIMSDKRMHLRLAECFSAIPDFKAQHRGRKGYEVFANAVLQRAEREAVPKSSTTTGYLQSLVIHLLQDRALPVNDPQTRPGYTVGFVMNECVYVNGPALVRQIHMLYGRGHTAEDVWQAAKALGAREVLVNDLPWYPERLWVLPLGVTS